MSDQDRTAGRFEEELLQTARSAIVVCRADRIVTFASPHAVQLFGCELLGQDIASLVSPSSADGLISYLARLAGADGDVAAFCETRVVGDGERIVESVGVNRLSDGVVDGIVLAVSDVTEHHHRAAALERRATTDALTGLPNRVVFTDRLTQAIRSGRGGVLAMIDLDNFKLVNDAHGHGVGDAVLIGVGRRMQESLEVVLGATAARVGGDEFVVLLPATTIETALVIIEGIQRSLAEPHRIGNADIVVTASAGLAECGGTAARTSRAADEALYAAKRDRGELVVFTPQLVEERRGVAAELEALRERNQELAAEARTDPLTLLPNRRRYDEDVKALDSAARQGACTLSVIAIDIDHFGRFNKADGGQDAGDKALRRAAKAFASAIREGDILYRRGGEEFVVLLPDAVLEDALSVADRIRGTLKRRRIPHPDQERVTASIGISTYEPSQHKTIAGAIAAADAAMRIAKDSGRDRIEVDRRAAVRPDSPPV
jgi:diguanylate cyclase (GGDEF)-like protein/PAS domain S-box-containing protein